MEGIITSHENETMILNGLGVMRSRENYDSDWCCNAQFRSRCSS